MLSLSLLIAVAAHRHLPPCPGMNSSIVRPPGSNCLGVVPRECGADRVRGFTHRVATPSLRAEVARVVGHQRLRWIRPGEPVTQDLRRDRLNLQLDRFGRIAKADCY